ncbi:MAG: preprotein translocase subunit SecY [Ruminococcaceae bacterium]|nr:preprotein translocase subunit SecY [Oscillospiraceae bacterium]
MFKTLVNAWKLADLRKKMLYTLIVILLYRVGVAIPIPYLDSNMLSSYMALTDGSIFQYLNILSGNAFSQATLFALGVSPYITSSIVMQLLTIAIPALENMAKEGEDGRKKINKITRYVTVGLALVTAYGYYMLLRNNGVLVDTGVFAAIVIIASYCAGAALVMWLGEKINENGIGNGISMILFANIVSSAPSMLSTFWANLVNGTISGPIIAIVSLIMGLAMVVFIVFMHDSERRLPIQYAKKVVGRKMYGGQSSTLPLKLTMTGVMPIIFANSISTIPATIALFFPTPAEGSFWAGFLKLFSSQSIFYAILTFALIIAFAYFYTAISFNPIEVSNNLKKNGGFIPGIRPGKPTAEYITKILNRITLIGAIMLSFVAVVPMIANIIAGGALGSLAFSGNSIIIVVGVILETVRELESQMTMRHYKGFLE